VAVFDTDFWINIVPEHWEHDDPPARFFERIYTVALNSHVRIAFVPDVSDVCPPWSVELILGGAIPRVRAPDCIQPQRTPTRLASRLG
jgi:hypothetical protein